MNLSKFAAMFKSKPNRLEGCDFTLFEGSKHHLDMLAMSFEDLIFESERLFSLQVPESKLSEVRLISPPQWLVTVGTENDKGLSPLKRAACAISLSTLIVAPTMEKHALDFIFSFSFVDIGTKTVKHQFWIDVNVSLEEFGDKGELIGRLYRLESNLCESL